ncbi:serine hydrolase domain-containing protein [Flavobacterium enshiense]|uniref:serine hydrolase domain-containing protein n=1 Tax=Flavobacterium enshiense TaxID=1341165 RepID=UPI00345CA551
MRYEKPNSPGLSIGIVQNNKLIYSKGIGCASLEYNIKNSDSTAFSLASIAKQFTAACLWTLVRDGKISLEDDIRKHLPELPERKQSIKIKHLLNHSSGLSNYHTLMALKGFDYDLEYYDNETVLELACKQKKLNHVPGTKTVYGNTSYTLLALIIERIAQKNLQEYAKTELFDPLGMNHTQIRLENQSLIRNKAVGYQQKGNEFLQNPRIQKSYGAGSMASTITDMAKWLSVLNGTNLQFKKLTEFLTTCDNSNPNEKANYARGVMTDNYNGYKTISHSGYGWGGQSQLITLPEKQLGIIILTNLESINPTPLSYEILNLLLPAKNTKSETKKTVVIKSNPRQFKQFVGQYKEINSDMKMEILMENDTLKAKGSQAKKAIALKGYEKEKFHRIANESVKYDFNQTQDHDLIIRFGGTPFYFKRAVFVQPETIQIQEFVGDYHSEELDVTYHFSKNGNQLFLSYKNNENQPVTPVQKDEFGNNRRTLYHFIRDENQNIKSFLLSSEGTVQNILFIKK